MTYFFRADNDRIKDMNTTTCRPAQGLQMLTWPQIEQLDTALAILCRRTETSKGDARLTLVIKNGKPRFIEQSSSEEFCPTRAG